MRNAYRCCESGTVGGKSSRAARVWRRAIECEREEDKRRVGGRGKRKRGWHTRKDRSISKESNALLFHKDDVRRPPPCPLPPLPSRVCPPHLSALGAAFPVAVSSPFAPLSRARFSLSLFLSLSLLLSSYQIESLYFASSIISFINLRAFRTL